ncbi:MAG: hypothetical protein CSA60_04005 [Neptuniibacter caesariensis]|uniref:Roadblock/LAMTOR2 domain-containing protein n=1 Tax=Neptuniibacter caesariensis TaxID=207954 RepID=A0A2G6JMQ2_NEPCE|nr:MAG: hypothetical protein CSA60_04005 [Neptuniibacter caesariensis]
MTSATTQNQFIQICPAGAFYATVGSEPDDARALLLQLLSSDVSLPFSRELIVELTDLEGDEADKLFEKLVSKNFVGLSNSPSRIISDSIEKILPALLKELSSSGKVALADDHGFCLGSTGYEPHHAEALCALAADLSSLHERHSLLLNRDLSFMGESWGMLDPVGLSQVGFWVIHLGHQRFVLIIDQMPRLNQSCYVDLLSVLARRYLDY